MKLKECSYEKFVTFIYCLSIKFHIISNFWEIASGNTIFQGYTMIDVFLKKKKKKHDWCSNIYKTIWYMEW